MPSRRQDTKQITEHIYKMDERLEKDVDKKRIMFLTSAYMMSREVSYSTEVSRFAKFFIF